MPAIKADKAIDFYVYPPVGEDDWGYMFQSAQARTLEMQLLSRAMLMDMVNADSFESAVAALSSTEYAVASGSGLGVVEEMLAGRRLAVRSLFADWMLDGRITKLFKSRTDYANLRLAIRRVVTDRPVGDDYSDEGNVPAEMLKQILNEQSFDLLPDYLSEAADEAVLGYYQNKRIPQIDLAIDRAQYRHFLQTAAEVGSLFLTGLFRVMVDLTNIRTMLRVKMIDGDLRGTLLEGGFIEPERYERGLEAGFEGLGALFGGTPYQRIVDLGAGYAASEKSFLKVEQECDAYLMGFLKSTSTITAGPQPLIAYLLIKEHEIRTVRLILTARKSGLDTRLIQDRVS